ncbi:MAG: DUF547 domain-containing protein [Ferruginibacter sp.]|nr:DUF547 domain-containing protein [Cytophagales bacterium]
MKKIRLFVLCFLLCATAFAAAAQANLEKFTQEADAFLRAHVRDGKVDYANVKKDFQKIKSLYDQVGRMNLANAPDNARKAFYLNAYNLAVIYQVAWFYPLKSALDASGFFDQVKHPIAGESMTLNALEITKLIKTYGDARVHFTLACAAKGCPKLAGFAFQPATLDAQLDERAKLALNNPYFIRVNKNQKKAEVSKIFDWYKKDFTGGGKTVLAYINQYRREAIPADYTVGFYEYDWSLNSQ